MVGKSNGTTSPVSNRVKEIRNELHISLDELCRRSGVSRSNLWEIETNGRSPSIDNANRIASALGKPVSEVFPQNPRSA